MTSAWVDLPALEVVPVGPVSARLAAPASKSVTNRALLVAALARGDSRLRHPLDSDDARAMRAAVGALGARVDDDGDDWTVSGTGGALTVPATPIDAGLSGTTLRFVAAAAALAPAPVTVTGRDGLLRRPVGALVDALRALGATVSAPGGVPPVVASGGLRGGTVTVDATASSQFASAVLLAAPYADADVTVTAAGPTADAYVALTVDLMRRWGVAVADAGEASWRVPAGDGYRARDEAVEYDASAAAHLFALAAATGGTVTVTNVAPATRQPDAAVPALLERMGATVSRSGARDDGCGASRAAPVDGGSARRARPGDHARGPGRAGPRDVGAVGCRRRARPRDRPPGGARDRAAQARRVRRRAPRRPGRHRRGAPRPRAAGHL